MSEVTPKPNGTRKIVRLTVMSVIGIAVIGILAAVCVFYFFALNMGNTEVVDKLSELLGTLAVMLVGGFLAIAKDLFKEQ